MKEIRAYIQPYMLTHVTRALMELPDFPGMSVTNCEGFGRERAESGHEYKTFFDKKRIEIFAPDDMVDAIFDTLMRTAHTGHHGDGKVYIVAVLHGGRISSGECGPELA
jgi:nitrogen regulatory protein P-II 1